MQGPLNSQARADCTLRGHSGIEKFAQTQTPPSSFVGQEQPHATPLGHAVAAVLPPFAVIPPFGQAQLPESNPNGRSGQMICQVRFARQFNVSRHEKLP